MIIGQTIFSNGANAYFSPWFPRQGDSGVFAGEVIAATGTLTVGVQTKNRSDTDPTAITGAGSGTLGSFSLTSAAPLTGTVPVSAMKELVRFYYVVTGADKWVHFRVLPPAWKANGA